MTPDETTRRAISHLERSDLNYVDESVLKRFMDKLVLHFYLKEAEEGVMNEVLEFVKKGQKIRAIKKYRELTGLNLRQCKYFIDKVVKSDEKYPIRSAANLKLTGDKDFKEYLLGVALDNRLEARRRQMLSAVI